MGILFNSLNLAGQPVSLTSALAPCTQVYPGSLWDDWGGGEEESDQALPSEAKVKAAAATWPTDRPVWLNIEHLQLVNAFRTPATDEVLLANHGKVKQIFAWAKEVNPSLWMGHYGNPTTSVSGSFTVDGTGGTTEAADWLRAVSSGLVATYDFLIYPGYSRYDDSYELSWGRRFYIGANLMRPRARAVGKPIYGFFWPLYHDQHATTPLDPIPPRFMRQQAVVGLNVLDGAFLWSDHTAWSEDDDAWWDELRPTYLQHRSGAVP